MCTESQLNILLSHTVSAVQQIFDDKLNSVILFGSYARGDYDEESDIDILILADIPAKDLSSYRKPIDHLCGELLMEYGIVVSIIEKDAETYNRYKSVLPFYKNIELEGRKIA